MNCPICEDTGWKAVDSDGVRRVVRCDCWRSTQSHRLLAEARIPPRYAKCTLDNFITYPNEKLLKAVARAKAFADQFPAVDRGLFFIGPPGIGKTHLAVAVLRLAIQRCGAKGLFYEVADLLRLIRATYNPQSRSVESDVLQPVMEAELLVLDDLGREKPSEWVDETLNLIVNTRYNQRRITIVTTNFLEDDDPENPNSLLARIGVRMHSRLYEMCDVMDFDGADFRHCPTNGGAEDLMALWDRRKGKKLPSRSAGNLRAQLTTDRREFG
jgi:DNA replication protein DnaC